MRDTKKTLVIGTGTNGIGDAVVTALWANGWFTEGMFCPTIEQMDMRDEGSILSYIFDNGPFDEIVYSAGVSQLRWISDLSAESFDDVMSVNARGAVLVAAAHERYHGTPVRYVVLVSDAADTPMRGSLSYCVSKAALEMAVRCMARELAPKWTVVGVSPGVVEDTGMTNQLARDIPRFRGWTPEQALEYENSSSVIGRRVHKEEVADTIFFALTGPQALNGSILTINGGK